jgi:hypothetical protein
MKVLKALALSTAGAASLAWLGFVGTSAAPASLTIATVSSRATWRAAATSSSKSDRDPARLQA